MSIVSDYHGGILKLTKQINIKLTDEAYQELMSFKKDLGVKTMPELFQYCVSVSRYIRDETKHGFKLILKNGKSQKEVVLLK